MNKEQIKQNADACSRQFLEPYDEEAHKESNMKSRDLMIGDWVKVNFGVHNKNIGSEVYGQVAELYDDERIKVFIKGSYWNIEKERGDEILPIPLTSEILEKNGFYEIEKDKFQKTQTHIYVLSEYEERFAICGNDEQSYYLGINLNSYPVFVGSYFTSEGRWVLIGNVDVIMKHLANSEEKIVEVLVITIPL